MLAVEQLSNMQLADATLSVEPCISSVPQTTTIIKSRLTDKIDNNNVSIKSHNTPPTKASFNKTTATAATTTADGDDEVFTYFGINFKAPFKWFNLISISLFHLYFVWTLQIFYTANTVMPNLLWGEFT